MQRLNQQIKGLLMASILAAGSVLADGNTERGEILADTCMGCHGIPGYRNAYPSYRVPKLGGQHGDYLVTAMQGYRSGSRRHPTMTAQGASLSDQDMQDIAAFLADQGAARAGTDDLAKGEAPESAVSCVACHGENGISPAATWPSLAGQHRDYLVESMLQYRNAQRADPVMTGQIMALSDDEIEDLAKFYAKQSGLFTVSYDD